LYISGTCCLLSPLFLFAGNPAILIGFLFIWAIAVIADSPLFSTLVAQNSPVETRGTSLTIVNCIGFAITIVSIQFLNFLSGKIDFQYLYMVLAAGPIAGIIALATNRVKNKTVPADILARIAIDFKDQKIREEVLAVIESLWTQPLNVGPAQLARSILVLSEGNVELLRKIFNEKFYGDPRDVIMQAEQFAGNPGHYFIPEFTQVNNNYKF
jgi:MFS family permease